MRWPVLLFLLLSGCCTVFRSAKQEVRIVTIPPGARAEDEKGNSCITPCSLNLSRKSGHDIFISGNGLQTVKIPIYRTYTAWWALDFPVILFIGIDEIYGSYYDLEPKVAIVTLPRRD